MIIDRVTYRKKFPTGAYLNEDIGFEGSIMEGESILQAIEQLRQLAENSHKEKYPHLYTESGSPVIVKQVEEEILPPSEKRIMLLIQDIENETELGGGGKPGLLNWRLLVEKNPELKQVYDKKFAELSKK